MNRRRAIASTLALIASSALAQQQGRIWRLGFLSANRRPASIASHRFAGFVQGLRELGYVEGKNLSIEWRFGDDMYDKLPALAAELGKLKVDVIAVTGTAATRAAQKATGASIPIVMLGVGDPVGSGLVDSLARPGRNTTGVSLLSPDLATKWFEIARSLVPNLDRIGVLLNPANPAYSPTLESAWRAAKPANVLVFPVAAKDATEFDYAFGILKRAGVSALLVQNDGVFVDGARRLGELAMKARLPTIAGRREWAEAGCLASYGTNVLQLYRKAASLVDKVLKGATAGELPVEQPVDFELFVNAKTAKAIDVTIPRELLLRADKVIE
jgi:putative ABC transport system substrate-binding protein